MLNLFTFCFEKLFFKTNENDCIGVCERTKNVSKLHIIKNIVVQINSVEVIKKLLKTGIPNETGETD